MTGIFPFRLFIDILLQMLRCQPRLYVQRLKKEGVSRYVLEMKNWWPYFLLCLVWVNAAGAVVAKKNENDTVSQRANRRAELRSALSVPAPVSHTGSAEENVKKNIFYEHQLSPQQRADLRRQLREQFRVLDLEASP